jgi:hypothetical protein
VVRTRSSWETGVGWSCPLLVTYDITVEAEPDGFRYDGGGPRPGRHSPSISSESVRPEALLRRLFDGSVTNVTFVDAERLLRALGFEELRVKGSHHVYGRPGIAQQLNLQEIGGQAKPYQLRQLTALVRQYHLGIEEDR